MRQTRSTRTDTLFPYTTRFRSAGGIAAEDLGPPGFEELCQAVDSNGSWQCGRAPDAPKYAPTKSRHFRIGTGDHLVRQPFTLRANFRPSAVTKTMGLWRRRPLSAGAMN